MKAALRRDRATRVSRAVGKIARLAVRIRVAARTRVTRARVARAAAVALAAPAQAALARAAVTALQALARQALARRAPVAAMIARSSKRRTKAWSRKLECA